MRAAMTGALAVLSAVAATADHCPFDDVPTDEPFPHCSHLKEGESFNYIHHNFTGDSVVVEYATKDITATAGEDYTAVSGSFTLPAGDQRTVAIVTLEDTVADEEDEFFSVFFDVRDARLGDAYVEFAIVNVQPPDPPPMLPTLSVEDITVREGDGNTVVQINLSGSSEDDVTFDYTTTDGTAVAPGDYTAVSGAATIESGDTSIGIVVPIIDDDIDEDRETVTFTISNPSGATIE